MWTAPHHAAGPERVHECRLLGGCGTGEAKLTRGYRLPARHIIHTVGLVWHGSGHGEAELLASCYRHCLWLAGSIQAASLAFPSISTGRCGYPIETATAIAVRTVLDHKPCEGSVLHEVIFCCFPEKDLAVYVNTLHPCVGKQAHENMVSGQI